MSLAPLVVQHIILRISFKKKNNNVVGIPVDFDKLFGK